MVNNMIDSALIRKIVVYFIYTMLIVCVQVSFPNSFTFNHQVMDFMFVYVCLVSYYFGTVDGLIIGCVVGICRDVLATPVIVGTDGNANLVYGLGLLLMVGVSLLSSNFFTKHTRRKFSFAMMDVLVMTILYKLFGHIVNLGFNIFILGKNYSLSFQQVLFDSVTTQFILNLLAALPIVVLLRFMGPYRSGINPRLLNKSEFGGDDNWLTI